ncbi:fimbrial protein [Buttiauxella sp. WJP83]|uniref:fimbrial protein n=1 Tax=Buttiauxella sp. WJP83 TaxID=2986951 RepID=UPI0022DE5B1D|nr:fimbrial protein [Buttiauxella sp. WJP83]WBM68858.1 fimbrial protein [Buttiauxella sp. WJP83]
MSINRLKWLFLGLFSVCSSVSANCNLSSQRIIASPETIMMKRTAQPGAVLHSRTYSVQSIQSQNCSQSMLFSAKITGDKSALVLPGVLQTNVKGIGAKVTLELSTGRIIPWPSEFSATADELKGSKISIELIKTGDNINTSISTGNISLQITSGTQSVPVIDIILPASYVNILRSSCDVTNKHWSKVILPDVALNKFTKQGSVAGRKPFDINLVCQGDMPSTPTFSLNWAAPVASSHSSKGVLLNLAHDGARNIGVQILDDKQRPINFNQQTKFVPINHGEGKYSIPFSAQYYQFGNNVRPGKINTFVYFNINYQ